MKEKIIGYVKKLDSSKSIKKVIKELSSLYEENKMYDLLAPCLIKLANCSKDYKLYEKIADIYQFKLRNFEEALYFYNRYMQKKDLDFYKKYATTIKHRGFSEVDIVFDLTEDNIKLRELCDRFDLLISLMLFLHKLGEYNLILDMKAYLFKFRAKIVEFIKTHRLLNLACRDDSKKNENYLADILARTKNNIDLNRFAIELAPMIKWAYINILEDYIFNKRYQEAIEFYNKFYAPQFRISMEKGVEPIAWHISDFYANERDYYMSVLYKKLSCEIHLGER